MPEHSESASDRRQTFPVIGGVSAAGPASCALNGDEQISVSNPTRD
jgi:hypothetical protein